MTVLRVILIAFSISSLACSSGKKAYERGDYDESVMLSIKRLRQNPEHAKSIQALQSAYPLAIEYWETRVNNEIASDNAYKWKIAIESYNRINEMYEQIRLCPGCLKIIKNPKNYYREIGPLKEKAAEESYNAGIKALAKGSRNDAKQAYYNFQDAQTYVASYKDVDSYLKNALEAATLRVVVEQIPVTPRYNLSGGFFQDKVEEFLHTYYQPQRFIRFFTPQEANALSLHDVDQIIKIQFDDFTVGNTLLKEKEEVLTRDSVRVGEVKVNGKNVPVYSTVKAKLTTYRKEVLSAGLLSMVVIDAQTNGILIHKKFEGQYIWVNTWARFNGDDRALTKEQLNASNQKELMPPPAQELFLQFTRPIYDQLIPGIKGFYQNY
jgi:hypothetical protein